MKLEELSDANTGLQVPPDLEDAGWVPFPIAAHRDSPVRHTAKLRRFEDRCAELSPHKAGWYKCRMGHWAVGWIDFVVIDPKGPCATMARRTLGRMKKEEEE